MLRRKNNSQRGRESLAVLVVLALALWSTPLSTAATKSKAYGQYVKFHRIDRHTDPAIVQFADAFMRKLIRGDDPIFPPWYEVKGDKAKPIELVRYLEADLNDDGVSELILQVGMGSYCGTAGCDSHVYRRAGGGFEEICSSDMYDLAIQILPRKEHGYHVLDVGELIVHWLDHPGRDGELCDLEQKPGYQ